MLLALHILLDTLAPAEQAPAVRALLQSITGDPVLCIVIAAALTWAAHSSVAVVLLVMSLAYSQFVTPEAALALVLGANLGSAINPLIESGSRGDPASRRLPVGNLINRLVGILIALPFLPADRAGIDGVAAGRREDDGRISYAVQCRACRDLHRAARRRGLAAGALPAGEEAAGRCLRCRAISTKPRWKRRRWRSPMPRARRCAWAIPSRPCCARS